MRHRVERAAALTNGAVEQAPGQGTRLQHGDAVCACGLAEDGDVVRIPTERGDVGTNPLERLDLIPVALVARNTFGALGRQFGMRKEAETTETIVDRHHDRAGLGEQPTRLRGPGTGL